MKKMAIAALYLFLPLALAGQILDHPRKNRCRYYLSVMTQFQQEAPYLKEWIEYHKLIGVEHFYLYNNSSTDNYREVLEPYIASGEVDLIDWPSNNKKSWSNAQHFAIRKAIREAKDETRWLALIDVDEFIVTNKPFGLIDFLNRHEAYGQIIMMWRYFGTSHVEKIPEDQLLIETLVMREDFVPGKINDSKCIVKPEAVTVGYVHYCDLKPGCKTCTYNDGLEENPPILLHHYWTRDYDFLLNIKRERQMRLGRVWSEETVERLKNIYNDVYDNTMSDFVPFLKECVLAE